METNRNGGVIRRALAGSTLVLGISLGGLAAAAQAQVALEDEPYINDTLRAAAVGKMIVDNCPTIGPRMILLFLRGQALIRYAVDQGYSEEEIRAFIDSRQDRKRLRAEAREYLAANGVVEGDKETYCALGREEIANDTPTGQLLRSLE